VLPLLCKRQIRSGSDGRIHNEDEKVYSPRETYSMNSLTLVTAALAPSGLPFSFPLAYPHLPFLPRPLQHLTLAVALLPMLTVVNSALPEASVPEHTSFPPEQLL
jgi:hypothetical protein